MTIPAPRILLYRELLAGSTVAFLLIPQSMAYAILAGVPPVYGLYAASLPVILYALFGSSKHLSIGPVSIVSLITLTGVSSLAQPESQTYLNLVTLLSLLVGVILLILFFLRAGRYLDRIPSVIIHGFTSGAAVIICMQQLGALTGISLPREEHILVLLSAISGNLGAIHPPTAALSALCLGLLYILHNLLPVSIGPLVIVIVPAAAVKRFQLDRSGIDIIGTIPAGLPELNWPVPPLDMIHSLIPTALAVSLITVFESYAVASSIAGKAGYKLKANRELLGLGAANIASSLVGSIPVAGAFSRTAVNYGSGGQTKLVSLVTSIVLLVTVLFFTKILYFSPKAVLAALIFFSVARLIDFRGICSPRETDRTGYMIKLITFFSTIIIGVAEGLLVGIAVYWALLRFQYSRKNNR